MAWGDVQAEAWAEEGEVQANDQGGKRRFRLKPWRRGNKSRLKPRDELTGSGLRPRRMATEA